MEKGDGKHEENRKEGHLKNCKGDALVRTVTQTLKCSLYHSRAERERGGVLLKTASCLPHSPRLLLLHFGFTISYETTVRY